MHNLHRIVHFDLKGAPLKIHYLEKVMLKCKQWGATGFLFEWEDTFPYTGDLIDIGSVLDAGGDGLYSMDEIEHIFQFVKDIGMEAIQLVQTIGHMEFVLKHPVFEEFREIPKSPAVLCPSKPGAKELVRKMVCQALDAQPNAQFFHIGADEVWHKAVCKTCKRSAEVMKYGADAIFLEYIKELTLFIKQKRPKLTVLMWDDMLRSMSENAIKEYDFTDIQPVYWNYNTIENFPTNYVLWQKYINLFPKIWAGSAFKGANGSCQVLSPASRYVSNHDAWLRDIEISRHNIVYVGIILTGWSRYDHFATLCELLPVMLPSLSSCLGLLLKPANICRSKVVREALPREEWPGEELARGMYSFVTLREKCIQLINGDNVATWLNPWQIERNYMVYSHVECIAGTATVLRDQIRIIKDILSSNLHDITGHRSAEEWLTTNIAPLESKICGILTASEAARVRVASVRPTFKDNK